MEHSNEVLNKVNQDFEPFGAIKTIEIHEWVRSSVHLCNKRMHGDIEYSASIGSLWNKSS
jgi:hypothetical protein